MLMNASERCCAAAFVFAARPSVVTVVLTVAVDGDIVDVDDNNDCLRELNEVR